MWIIHKPDGSFVGIAYSTESAALDALSKLCPVGFTVVDFKTKGWKIINHNTKQLISELESAKAKVIHTEK